MPPTTRGATAPRRKDKTSIAAPVQSPDGFENLEFPTPKRRKREPTDDDYMRFARSLVADDTEAALRVAGHEYVSTPSLSEERWCMCGIAEEEIVSVEDMIRCDNRQCTPGWFHLRCVKLHSHPPTKFGWFCKDCVEACNVGEAVKGLICRSGQDGTQVVKEWLVREKERKERKRNVRILRRTQALQTDGIQQLIEKDRD